MRLRKTPAIRCSPSASSEKALSAAIQTVPLPTRSTHDARRRPGQRLILSCVVRHIVGLLGFLECSVSTDDDVNQVATANQRKHCGCTDATHTDSSADYKRSTNNSETPTQLSPVFRRTHSPSRRQFARKGQRSSSTDESLCDRVKQLSLRPLAC